MPAYVDPVCPQAVAMEDRSQSDKSFIENHLRAYIDSRSCEDEEGEESFFVADLGEIYRQYSRWTRNLKRVKPFYGTYADIFASETSALTAIAVKCNPNIEVLRLLARLGTGFDCSSRQEIEQVLSLGVQCDRILYANPCKARSHLRYAQREGIRRMTFDSADELHKIKAIFPEANLLLRIATDDSSSVCRFSLKFGAPLDSTRQLLEIASELELNIVGVSFHVGSGATDPHVFAQAVHDSRAVFNLARNYGHSPKVLDVGGGFSTGNFEVMAHTLALALDEHFPGDFELLAEPGRYFVESAFTLACNVIARRGIRNLGSYDSCMLFLNDGVYQNFMDSLLSHWRPKPRILLTSNTDASTTECQYSIWGPTCDGVDQIIENVSLPKVLDVGDWLYFEGMGAYSLCLSTSFNGFSSRQIVYYLWSEPTTSAPFH